MVTLDVYIFYELSIPGSQALKLNIYVKFVISIWKILDYVG